MRIAIVQYGVFHPKFEEFRTGGRESYYAQRYSVDFVAGLAEQCEFLGVCGVLGDRAEEVALGGSLNSACIPLKRGLVDSPAIIALLKKWSPDRLILQTPDRRILRWALAARIATLPLLADSFDQTGLRTRIGNLLLGRLLSNPAIGAVGNHNFPACQSLRRIGVPAEKIYPWDWPHDLRPENHPPKTLGPPPHRLTFVGAMTRDKGVEDCLEAAGLLRQRGLNFRMTLIGGGDFLEAARARIKALSLDEMVSAPGRVDHDDAVAALAASTLSIVPSRRVYAEGLPMTIYETLATRTPLILSDHPMFQLYFRDTPAARMVPEKSPEAIADAVQSWLADLRAYEAASIATEALWGRIKCDLTWGALIEAWLGVGGSDLAAIRQYALDRSHRS